MKNAHELSSGLSPDPFYSATARVPQAPDSTLFGDLPEPGTPRWIYAPGDLEGWLLGRMRQEAFAVCAGIYHPGGFRRPHSYVIFSKSFDLDDVPGEFPVTFWHSGELLVEVNSDLHLRRPSASQPEPVIVDMAPFLKQGKNQIHITLTRLDSPPAVLASGPGLVSDGSWTCKTNMVDAGPVSAFPSNGMACFPHEERLPIASLSAPVRADGIADFGCVMLGRPDSAGHRGLGESVAEACSDRKPVQIRLADDGRDRAFQFVAVEPGAEKLDARISLHPARYAGAFACSDPELTRIWHHAATTLRVCMRELTVDGLKRDRLPWAGDAHVAALGNAAAFGEHRCIQRTLAALAPEDPAVCPTTGIIDYDLQWLLAVAAQWRFTGDRDFLLPLWPEIERLLAALRGREDINGLLRHQGTWLFIDWIEFDKSVPSLALQALYVWAMKDTSSVARDLGKSDAADFLTARAANLSAVIRSRARTHGPVPAGRHTRFLMQLAGLDGVGDDGVDDPAVSTPFMRFFEALAAVRGGDAAPMLDGLRSYWGGMLRAGASTFWEAYDPELSGNAHFAFYNQPFAKSLCHAWACGPLPLLSFELPGLRSVGPGWSTVSCRPPVIPLEWACATIPTPHGDIRWEYEAGTLALETPEPIALTASPVRRDGKYHIFQMC